MFDSQPDAGVWDSWVERWRHLRGIDKWPAVQAVIEGREWVDSGEDGYYRVTLIYRVPAGRREMSAKVSCSRGSSTAETPIGEKIEIRVSPDNPKRIVLADTGESALGLFVYVLFGSVAALLLFFRLLVYLRDRR